MKGGEEWGHPIRRTNLSTRGMTEREPRRQRHARESDIIVVTARAYHGQTEMDHYGISTPLDGRDCCQRCKTMSTGRQ